MSQPYGLHGSVGEGGGAGIKKKDLSVILRRTLNRSTLEFVVKKVICRKNSAISKVPSYIISLSFLGQRTT